MKKEFIYCFDIDGTLCTTNCEYKDAMPLNHVIKRVNALYDEGYTIVLCTSRGSISGVDWSSLTKTQVDSWGIKYHQLQMGKPGAHIYIDDRAKHIKDWCKDEGINYE